MFAGLVKISYWLNEEGEEFCPRLRSVNRILAVTSIGSSLAADAHQSERVVRRVDLGAGVKEAFTVGDRRENLVAGAKRLNNRVKNYDTHLALATSFGMIAS